MNALIQQLQAAEQQFEVRPGQLQMITFIESELTSLEKNNSSNVCIIEGQTGCGKSLGYLLALLPKVIASKKTDTPLKLVISTANVALQQQLLDSELPRLKASGMPLKYALAAGRGRYLCLQKVNHLCSNNVSIPLAKKEFRKIECMADSFYRNAWDGLRDSLAEQEACSDDVWQQLGADSMSCSNNACPFFQDCAFYRARNQLIDADIIVANHSLVLSDIEHNRILPKPEEALYVFDEAHHLPDIVRNQSKSSCSLLSLQSLFMQQRATLIQQILALMSESKNNTKLNTASLEKSLQSIGEAIRTLYIFLSDELIENSQVQKGDILDKTFSSLPDNIIRIIDHQILLPLDSINLMLEGLLDSASTNQNNSMDSSLLNNVLYKYRLISSFRKTLYLFNTYEGQAGEIAKWIVSDERSHDITIAAARVDVAPVFIEHFWNRCKFSVLTSATLTSLGNFDRFLGKTGLTSLIKQSTLRVTSPFEFNVKGQLHVDKALPTPNWRDEDEHTRAIYQTFFSDCKHHSSALLLFTSRRQMDRFTDMLTTKQEELCLIQYTDTRQNLVKRHKARIDRGQRSILIGVQSLSEGLDLPGGYLTFVGIAKIPFVDASCPISQAEIELHKRRGGNSFYDITLADACAKLMQATGRLLRTKQCWGNIVIYDPRLIKKSYGKALIDALPDYRLEIS